jgi:hypothetical protein
MPEKHFTAEVAAVAQIDTVQITADDAATTYTITIGGETVSVVGSGTGVNDTASDLKDALAAATHPYFAAITWTVATDTVTATAKVAGCPFTAASSVAGGAGTIGAVASSTACTGPHHYDDGGNWDDGSVPGAADDVHIDSNLNVCWGLDASATTLGSFVHWRNTGKIGLRQDRFATVANGDTYSALQVPEYRTTYLMIKVNGKVTIGKWEGVGTPAGSPRVKIDLGNQAAQVQIDHAGVAAPETDLCSIRMLANSATTDIFVRSAAGGFGLGVDDHGEVSVVGDIHVDDPTTASRVMVADGVTWTNYKQRGGTNLLQAAATATLVDADAGVLTIDGDFTLTTLNCNGATVYDNHMKTAASANTTVNLRSGHIDTSRSSVPRTWDTLTAASGGRLTYDPDVLTISVGNPPTETKGVLDLTF